MDRYGLDGILAFHMQTQTRFPLGQLKLRVAGEGRERHRGPPDQLGGEARHPDDALGLYLRQMGAEFAEKYPKIAARLNLEEEKIEA